MHLARPDVLNEAGDQRVFRASPLGSLIAFAIFATPVWFWPRILSEVGVSGIMWVIAGPAFAIGGLIWCLVLWTMGGVFWSTLRPTNWRMRIAPAAGVALNLRSYLNGHFEGTDPTVALIDFGEIESARRVREKVTQHRRNSTSIAFRSYLELSLSCDTEDLAIAIELERDCKAPHTKWLGVRSSTKHHDLPVRVLAPGIVWVQWSRGMLDALRPHVEIEEDRKVEFDARDGPIEARLRRLMDGGDMLAAIELARDELGLDLKEARDILKDRPAA